MGDFQVQRGVVAVYSDPGFGFAHSHERATREGIARQLAALRGLDFVGEYEPGTRYQGLVYLVPSDTLVGLKLATALGVRGEHDLFGGVVPQAFVATKAITHPLVSPDAAAPPGWSPAFGHRVRGAVLSGFTTFARADAQRAGERLLKRGPVRVKPVRATGGRGQVVISDVAALEAALGRVAAVTFSDDGLVLEENLAAVTTYSVGQVRVAELVATYCGTQRLTLDNNGVAVYGGSDLLVARGGFEGLAEFGLPEEARLAVSQAQVYDEAAAECFAGMFASRRNYDVARGADAVGRPRCGVLEQSWRVGGASGAELAALQAFRAKPALRTVRAATVDIYGEPAPPLPPNATVYFQGVDELDGPMTKYAMVEL